MIAEPGSAIIVEPESHLAVPPNNRRQNPFVTGLIFKNLPPGLVLHPRMAGREHFPSLVLIILDQIGTEPDPEEEDRISSIKEDPGPHQGINLFP